jgi:LAO/AO transport system kinase
VLQKPTLDALLSGDRRALAKCITLIESKHPDDRETASALIESVLPHSGNSLRIGISGVPGVGKSTFIESFGLHLIEQGKRVAVLAVDPSSPIAGGSILGDKTRMPELSRSDDAFIRPSPSSGIMGGIAQKTRESILLCEASGYDVILVETVGVGQVEVDVHGMVDFFLILMVPNAGDDLQGIKRGITELVDGIVINKSDGESVGLALTAKRHYQGALNLIRGDGEFFKPRVLTCSALEKTNLDEVWNMIDEYREVAEQGGHLVKKRERQNVDWLKRLINAEIEQRLMTDERIRTRYPELEGQVLSGETTPLKAADEIIRLLFSNSA